MGPLELLGHDVEPCGQIANFVFPPRCRGLLEAAVGEWIDRFADTFDGADPSAAGPLGDSENQKRGYGKIIDELYSIGKGNYP
jgi:hypothetical protein